MRVITQEAARKKLWESSTTKEVKRLFDGMAGDWSETRNVPTRKIPIVDALARGGAFGNTAIDLGAGTGLATQVLAEHFKKIAAIDLSIEMLKNSVEHRVQRVCADGAFLPLADRSVDIVLAMNMLLFPIELERCISTNGFLIWISSRGPATPIYLSPNEVIDLMSSVGKNQWQGIASNAGEGSWIVASRIKRA